MSSSKGRHYPETLDLKARWLTWAWQRNKRERPVKHFSVQPKRPDSLPMELQNWFTQSSGKSGPLKTASLENRLLHLRPHHIQPEAGKVGAIAVPETVLTLSFRDCSTNFPIQANHGRLKAAENGSN